MDTGEKPIWFIIYEVSDLWKNNMKKKKHFGLNFPRRHFWSGQGSKIFVLLK